MTDLFVTFQGHRIEIKKKLNIRHRQAQLKTQITNLLIKKLPQDMCVYKPTKNCMLLLYYVTELDDAINRLFIKNADYKAQTDRRYLLICRKMIKSIIN